MTAKKYPRVTKAELVRIILSETPANEVDDVLKIVQDFEQAHRTQCINDWVCRELSEENPQAPNGA